MKNNIEIPNEYLCPITLEIMKDPVIAMDGHSYERAAIEQWLQNNNRSPKMNIVLRDKRLVPNYALRSTIEEFIARSTLWEEPTAKTHVGSKVRQDRIAQKLHQENAQMAAILQWDETDGLAVDSRLQISELEYDCEQLLDWCGLNDQKNKELTIQLEQALIKEAELRREILESKHPQEEIHGYEKDLRQINEKLAHDPGNERFINIKATTLRKLQRTQEALAVLSFAIRKNPCNIYLLNTRGMIYVDMGQLRSAQKDFNQILSIDQKNSYGIGGLQVIEELRQHKETQKGQQKSLQSNKTYRSMQGLPQTKKMPLSVQDPPQPEIPKSFFWKSPSSQIKVSVQIRGEKEKPLWPSQQTLDKKHRQRVQSSLEQGLYNGKKR